MSRRKVSGIIGGITLLIFLFMPFLSEKGVSVSIGELLGEVGIDLFFKPTHVFGDFFGYACLAIIISAVVVCICGFLEKISQVVIFSIIGAIATLIVVFSMNELLEYLGIGVWLTLVGFAVSFFISLGD